MFNAVRSLKMARTRSHTKKVIQDKAQAPKGEQSKPKKQAKPRARPRKGKSGAPRAKQTKRQAQEELSLDREQLKLSVERALKNQILAHVPNNPMISAKGLDKDGLRDGTEAPEEIGTSNWLEWQHVYGLLPSLVAERKHLFDSVGIFPAFSATRMNELLQNEAELVIIKNLGLPTRVTPNGDTVLIEKAFKDDSKLTAKERAAKKRELAKINREARQRRQQAAELLENSNLGENNAFTLYLEAIGESKENFLGNPKKPDLSLDECQQFIIPFHYQNNHYTVAVVHFVRSNKQMVADIKYYDSIGSDLDDSLKTQLIAYCESLGFKARYTCASKPDQKEGYNCSMFASFKAIDICNSNFKHPERFLSDLTSVNYDQVLIMLRYTASLMIKAFGQNVKPSSELAGDLKAKLTAFIKSSEYAKKVSDLNSFINDLIGSFNKTLKITGTLEENKKPLPDRDPAILVAELKKLYEQAKKLIEPLQKNEKQSDEEKATIAAYLVPINLYEMLSSQIERQIEDLKGIKKTLAQESSNSSWIASIGWKTLLLMMPLGAFTLFFGLPAIATLVLQLATMLPSNPAMTIFAGALIFSTGTLGIYLFNGFINPQEKASEKSQQKTEALEELGELLNIEDMPDVAELVFDPDQEVIEKQKSLLNQFDKAKQNGGDKAINSESGLDPDIEILPAKSTASAKSRVSRKLNF